jgi:hypothetical protein
MSAFDLVHDHIARTLAAAAPAVAPAVAQATPLASADDIREAIEVLTIEADDWESVGTLSTMALADQLRRVIKLLRASRHRVGG